MRWWQRAIGAVLVAMAVPLGLPAANAQSSGDAPRPGRMVLASTRLNLSADSPLHFKLLRVELPPGRIAPFSGDHGLLFVLSGRMELTVEGAAPRTLDESEGAYL